MTSWRRKFVLAPAMLALTVGLAACGSQLDPDTVAAANGGGVVGGDLTTTGSGTDTTGGTGGTTTTGGAGGGGTTGGTGGGGATGGTGGTGGTDTTGGGTTGGGGDAAIGGQKASCDGFKNQTGITDDKIVLANVSDLSGPVPGLFQSALDGARAFAAFFNATSDICGRKIEISSLDSRTDAGADQQGYTKACETAFAAVGSMSAFDSGGAATAQNCGLPDIRSAAVTLDRAACSTCFGAQSNNSNFFENAVPDYVKRVAPAASKKGAFLYLNAGAAAENAKGQINAQKRRGITYLYTQGIDVSEFNYAPYVQQMKDKGVQYLQYLGSYQAGVRLAQAMQSAGFKPDLFMLDLSAYEKGFLESGGTAVEGATVFLNILPFEQAASNKEMSTYLKYLQQVNPGAQPSVFGAFAWSAARIFVEQAQALGGRLDRKTLIDRVKGVNKWTANGMHAPQMVGSRQTGDCWRFVKVQGGKFVPQGNSYSCSGLTPTK